MTPLRPPEGEDVRWRPRDGPPRCIVEYVSQMVWKTRHEVMLIYIVIAVTVAVVIQVRGR